MNDKSRISISTYDREAETLADKYNARNRREVNAGFFEALAASSAAHPRRALDLGCGSGADAFEMAQMGYDVVAVDASAEMLRLAREKKSHPQIAYIHDTLPDIEKVKALGLGFDAVLMSAVWMHLDSGERAGLVRLIAALMNKEAIFYITLRHGDSPAGRPMFPVSAGEVQSLAAQNNMRFEHKGFLDDPPIKWEHVILRPL